MPAGSRPSRTIALMNQKGGVGKTTTAVNLAAGIALQGRPVLLIDLDPQAHATLHLGVETGPERLSSLDLLSDPNLPLREAVVEARPNLFLVPAVTDLAIAEAELVAVPAPDRYLRVRRALDAHAASPDGPRFDVILFDCPPSLGVLTLSALAAAGEVLVPMQAHFLALQGFGKLMETVVEVTKLVNPGLRVSGVVICQHDATTTHSREVVADLDAFFEQSRAAGAPDRPWRSARVLRPLVRRNVKMTEAPSFGKTIFEYAPWCPAAVDFRSLAERLVAEIDHLAAPPIPPAPTPVATPPPTVVTRAPSGALADADAQPS